MYFDFFNGCYFISTAIKIHLFFLLIDLSVILPKLLFDKLCIRAKMTCVDGRSIVYHRIFVFIRIGSDVIYEAGMEKLVAYVLKHRLNKKG